jgi:hypothetical protein
MNNIKLGRLAGLDLSVQPLAFAGSIVLLVVLAAAGIGVLRLPFGEALLGSLVAVGLHWASDLAHQLGHAWTARPTGHPMIGIRFGTWGILGTALYPADEPPLPGAVHIRRAAGGPIVSFLLSLAAGAAVLALWGSGGAPWGIAVFCLLDNVLVFTLGALLPLDFTDGGIFLKWWGRR